MKKMVSFLLAGMVFLTLPGCSAASNAASIPPETTAIFHTLPAETTESAPVETTFPETAPPETTVPETTQPVPVLELTEEEQQLLLQLGMAEVNAGLGYDNCPVCIALVMRTVLNRQSSGRFSKTIRGVIYAPEQFTPVMDGSFDKAQPDAHCQEALEMVLYGWDESQGCLYYEFCDGPSWHSQNLNLLFQHCNTRFYN